MLARREHSAFELRRKLKQKDFAQDEIEQAIVQLKIQGLQSDSRYAESYINVRKDKGYGPQRIALELKERGVSESDYAPFLYAPEIDWSAIMRAEYKKKFGNTACEDYQEKAKRIRYLQYRGFVLDIIRDLVE